MRFANRFCVSGLAFGLFAIGSAFPCQAAESLSELRDIGHAHFNHEGSRLVVSRANGSISIWEVQGGKMIAGNLAPKTQPESFVVSADGKIFLAAFKDGHARVFDSSAGKALSPLLNLRLKTDLEMAALFSPDGSSLVTFADRQATVFNVTTGKRVVSIPLEVGPNEETIGSAKFTRGGAQCFVIAGDGKVRRYDTKDWKPIGKPIDHPEIESAYDYFFAVSDDGKWLATYDSPGENGPKGSLQVWDAAAEKPLGEPLINMNGLTALFVGNNRVLIIPERGTEGKVYDLPSMNVAFTIPAHDDIDGPKAAVSPDGKWIVAWCRYGEDNRLDLIDAATGKVQGQHTGPARIVHVFMAPDSSGCFVAFDNAASVNLGFPELKITQTLSVAANGKLPWFSPNGKRFMILEGEGDKERILFFDAATLKPLK